MTSSTRLPDLLIVLATLFSTTRGIAGAKRCYMGIAVCCQSRHTDAACILPAVLDATVNAGVNPPFTLLPRPLV